MTEGGGQGPQPFLELVGRGATRVFPLVGARVAVGRDPSSDIPLEDPAVSRHHLLLENVGAAWVVRDLGSANGTFVNGQAVAQTRVLKSGDELLVGETRLAFRSFGAAGSVDQTVGRLPLPYLTRREREVLLALCAPLFGSEQFPQPASARGIASALFITEDAVKQHLLHLYDKFDLTDPAQSRRLLLAREAVRRGAVTAADVGP